MPIMPTMPPLLTIPSTTTPRLNNPKTPQKPRPTPPTSKKIPIFAHNNPLKHTYNHETHTTHPHHSHHGTHSTRHQLRRRAPASMVHHRQNGLRAQPHPRAVRPRLPNQPRLPHEPQRPHRHHRRLLAIPRHRPPLHTLRLAVQPAQHTRLLLPSRALVRHTLVLPRLRPLPHRLLLLHPPQHLHHLPRLHMAPPPSRPPEPLRLMASQTRCRHARIRPRHTTAAPTQPPRPSQPPRQQLQLALQQRPPRPSLQ